MPQRPLLTGDLAREYTALFAEATLRPQHAGEVRAAADRIFATRAMDRYQAVSGRTGVPAPVVGILHVLEAGGDFTRHLHNGDPLSARTVRVPAGRPVFGTPPFSWEDSAVDALRLKKLDQWTDWSVSGIAYVLEGYNGFGYRNRRPEALSPYLWSFTTCYTSGKFVVDHVYDPMAVSRQCGGMALLRAMADAGRIDLPGASPAAGQGG
jgi:lysozyme family protein